MQIPGWALLLSFWLHMLATVVWLGSLTTLALLIIPTLRRTLRPDEFSSSLAKLNARLDPLGWLCLGALTFTGLIQMEDNPNYLGLFNISNPWAQAICLKHIVFFGMIAVSAYLTWGLMPSLRRAVLKPGSRKLKVDFSLIDRFQRLVALNLVLGLLVLVFTALARVS
jgi:putative copper export protein